MALKIQARRPAQSQPQKDIQVILAKSKFVETSATQVFVPYFDNALVAGVQETGYFTFVGREGQDTPSVGKRTLLVIPHVQAHLDVDARTPLSCCLGATIIGIVFVFFTPLQIVKTSTKCALEIYDVTDKPTTEVIDKQTRQAVQVYPLEGMTPISTLEVTSSSESRFSPTDAGNKVIVPNHTVTAQNLVSRVSEAIYSVP